MSRPALLAIALLLAGCQTVRYEAKGERNPFGYSSESISDRRFSVTYQGDATTELAQARDFALLRAAELTREAGGTHFKVVVERNRLQRDLSAQWTGPITGGNAITGSREYPAVWLEVEIYRTAPPASPALTNVFDASETQATLVNKYHLSGSLGVRPAT